MEQAKSEGVDNKAKIDILLKEYDVLNAKVASRINNRFAMTGFAGAVGTFVYFRTRNATSPCINTGFWTIVLVFTVISLLVLWFVFGQLIKNCAVRISKIEERINELAGEKLLKWETHQLKNGIFHFFYWRSNW
ncbi:MAG: hypothetical protein KAS96_12085 [Planctomycetes bacterium]|nr:hypothetical protein [Planctomycetota bacterium]